MVTVALLYGPVELSDLRRKDLSPVNECKFYESLMNFTRYFYALSPLII